MRRCEKLVIKGTKRGKGRPEKYWREVIRHDITQLRITEDMILDRKDRLTLGLTLTVDLPEVHCKGDTIVKWFVF
ncbi:hypothetical protein H5410_035542 [Solanum commersonii]|uniref:Uncharacterized protein n=1 Tax=Solanum commersonii TaxID=4109 RepID=A0A9J5Y5G3_SOLCO|nr:hypothetical protein H5410_035542 [Solanum commersonii]